jgi:hypothetical protein
MGLVCAYIAARVEQNPQGGFSMVGPWVHSGRSWAKSAGFCLYMDKKNSVRKSRRNGGRQVRSRGTFFAFLFCLAVASINSAFSGHAQTAFLSDAFWTYQQDCNGDTYKAGTLPGNLARLNWDPEVTNCSSTLTVFEKVYYKPCAASTWTAIYTNAPHSIVACQSSGQQHLDVLMGGGSTCRDYKIEIYRNGRSLPDYIRSSTNDVDLAQHHEQLLSEDFCLSDFFASCASLSGVSGSESDNNSNATKEPGEPNHAGNPGGKSLWYCWTAPTNKPVTFDTSGSTFDTVLAVYTGNDFTSLSLVGNNDDINGSTNRQSRVSFTPTIGVTYHIAVDGFAGASGIISLNWYQTGAALPDLIFWGPRTVPHIVTRTFSTSPSECEVVEGCETAGTHTLLVFDAETRNIGSGDLVLGDPSTNALFVYASCHGHWHFEQFAQYDLLGTNGNIVATGHKVGFCLGDVNPWSPTAKPKRFDCALGNKNQGIQVGWADVYTEDLACQYIDITGVPAGDYILELIVNPDNLIAESNTGNNTTLVPISIPAATCVSVPTNDSFANPITVTNLPFTFSEFNNCATKQVGEPSIASAGGHSVWFAWTPGSNQTAVVTTKRSSFDTVLGVYTGNSVSSLTRVATNDDIIAGTYIQSQVSFAAVAGTTYHIVVDGFGGAVGMVVLNVGPPGNDDFASAFVLSGILGTTNGFNMAGSKEPLETAHAGDVGGHSIWYRWIAPKNGPVNFDTAGSTFDTTLGVYTNNVIVTNMIPVAGNDDDAEGAGVVTSRVGFNAAAGTTYRIAVDGFGGDTGNVTLNWNMDSQLRIVGMPDGTMQIVLSGVDSQRYTLLESTNFVTWTTNTAPITMSGGSHTYTNSPAIGREYYRAVLVP